MPKGNTWIAFFTLSRIGLYELNYNWYFWGMDCRDTLERW